MSTKLHLFFATQLTPITPPCATSGQQAIPALTSNTATHDGDERDCESWRNSV